MATAMWTATKSSVLRFTEYDRSGNQGSTRGPHSTTSVARCHRASLPSGRLYAAQRDSSPRKRLRTANMASESHQPVRSVSSSFCGALQACGKAKFGSGLGTAGLRGRGESGGGFLQTGQDAGVGFTYVNGTGRYRMPACLPQQQAIRDKQRPKIAFRRRAGNNERDRRWTESPVPALSPPMECDAYLAWQRCWSNDHGQSTRTRSNRSAF